MNHRTVAILSAALVLFASHAAADDTARFTVTVTGQGPDVILIPGLACSGAVWDATVHELAPSHRVHVVQVAGFAGVPAGANSDGPVLAPLVEKLAGYAGALDRPALIGHSLGGLIALEIAARHPDSVDRVLVVDALPFYPLIFSPLATADAVAPQAAMIRDQLLALSDAAYAQSESASVVNLVKSEPARARVIEWALKSDRRVVATAMHDDMVEDARTILPRIAAPVTVLYAYDPGMGRPAKMVDALYASAFAGLSGATLRRVDGSYHFIMLDQPEAFAHEVANFIR